MEPARKHRPEIEPDIRPTLGHIQDGDESGGNGAGTGDNLANAERSAAATQAGSKDAPVREQEEAPDMGLYRPDSASGGKNRPEERGKTVSVRTILKKRGPLAAIMTIGLGLPTILTIFLSPALLLQQFTETLTGRFNDQLAALDVRSTLLLKKKYNSTLTKGTCGTKVTIHCRYQSIRENSGLAKRLKNAGVEIDGSKSIVPGRIKPASFTFQGKSIQAKDLLKEARVNPELRAALRKGYDPLFAGFSDKISTKVRTALGLKKSSNVKSSTDTDKMDEDLKKTAAGTDNLPADGKKLTAVEKDGEVTGYTDDAGTSYTVDEGNRINNLIDEGFNRNELAKKVSKTAVKSSLKGALTVTSMGAGAVDSLCSAWIMVRVAGFAAKIYQQKQLIRYSYEFVKIGHKQKQGDLTAEEMTYFGNKLTQVNSEGDAALDSDGYKFAAYGDVFSPASFDPAASKSEKDQDEAADKALLQNESSRYVNGQLLNDNMMSKLIGAITSTGGNKTVDGADSVCKFTKSWKGQALVFGLAAAGLVVAVLTGGGSVGAGALIQGAASVAISVALALIQPKLIDMAKGEVIKGDENGNETGNAVASGMGGYNAQTAQGGGLRVASQTEFADYNKRTNELIAQYEQEDRDSRSPFDPTSKNTFLGSIVSSILPYSTKMQTVGSSSLALTSMVGNTLSSLGSSSTTYAADEKTQYSQCDDAEYKGYAADPFCNLRYMLPETDLDPDTVLDYMLEGGYVTEDDPTPLGDYAEYVKTCIDRTTSIGDPYTEDGGSSGDKGDACVVGKGGENEKRNNMFALFYVDSRVEDGFDNDFDEALVGTEAVADTNVSIASFNVLGASHTDGPKANKPNFSTWTERIKLSVNTINNNGKPFDVIGFQEFEPVQRAYMKENLTGYKMSSKGKESDSIMWNDTRFELVQEGSWESTYFDGKIQEPWVKLRDRETEAEFYVMSVHDPIDKGQGSPEVRYQNALGHLAMVNKLKTDGPVYLVGDFNSAYTKDGGAGAKTDEKLTYCVLTGGGMNDAYDLSVPRDAKCPNKPKDGDRNAIDHVYMTPEIQVQSFTDIPGGNLKNGSDHPTIVTETVIPGTAVSTGAGTNFVIGTYNTPTRGNSTAAYQKILENKMDIIGMQELGGENYFNIKNNLAKNGYSVFPDVKPGETDSYFCGYARPIFFNSSGATGTKFKLIKSEIFDVPSYAHKKEYQEVRKCGNNGEMTKGGGRSNVPVAWLQDIATGQTIIVINTHNLASCCGADQAPKKRFQSSEIYVNKVTELKAANPGVPIFFSGDFNEGVGVRRKGNTTYQLDQNNLLYCMFKQTGLMFRAIAGRDQECKTNTEGYGGVDYVYATPGVKVEWTKSFLDPSTNDHPHRVEFGKLVVPGSGGAKVPANSKGWVWPTKGPITNGNCYNVDVGGLSHAGMDINTPSANLEVLAMSDGVVAQKGGPSGAAGNYFMVKATDGTYYAYQHLKNSPSMKVGDPITAGQVIGIAGLTGNVQVYSSKAHLHITMATKATLGSYGNHASNFDPMKKLQGVKPASYNCDRS